MDVHQLLQARCLVSLLLLLYMPDDTHRSSASCCNTHVVQVYAQEWEQSLRESHPTGPQLDALLAQQAAEVGSVQSLMQSADTVVAG